jgi:hypothetical protein
LSASIVAAVVGPLTQRGILVFDTVTGLPLHALTVHAVVVLLPLAALATIAVAVRPPWRRYSLPVVVLDAVMAAVTFVAAQSGEALEGRVRQISEPAGLHDHTQWGQGLSILSFALFLGSVIMHFGRRWPRFAPVVAAGAVIGGLLILGVTLYVGHTGASLVWRDVIANTVPGHGEG